MSLVLKPELSFAIMCGSFVFTVVSAVKLNNKPLGWTEEVNDIRTNRRLSSKMRALHGELFQSSPQSPLMRCRISS